MSLAKLSETRGFILKHSRYQSHHTLIDKCLGGSLYSTVGNIELPILYSSQPLLSSSLPSTNESPVPAFESQDLESIPHCMWKEDLCVRNKSQLMSCYEWSRSQAMNRSLHRGSKERTGFIKSDTRDQQIRSGRTLCLTRQYNSSTRCFSSVMCISVKIYPARKRRYTTTGSQYGTAPGFCFESRESEEEKTLLLRARGKS